MTTTLAEPATRDRARTATVADDPRWARIVARDCAADGFFWYSVATTGVYCRPSCASRAANPLNVTIHGSLADARATGCRPCKRCRPDDTDPDAANAARIAAACRAIAAAEEAPTLARLAADASLSPGHFHRLFRAATGVTPRGYASALRAERLRAGVAASGSTTAALLDAGYGAAGRDYADAAAALGMSPRAARTGGAGETLGVAFGESRLGTVLVATSARGVAAILLGDSRDALAAELGARFPAARIAPGDGTHAATVAQAIALVDDPGSAAGAALPLDIRGTLFQQRVWTALRAIPAGETTSYAALATRLGMPTAARAVAAACAANAHAVAIPCHRVVRGDGALAGYRWGVDRKRALLAREREVD